MKHPAKTKKFGGKPYKRASTHRSKREAERAAKGWREKRRRGLRWWNARVASSYGGRRHTVYYRKKYPNKRNPPPQKFPDKRFFKKTSRRKTVKKRK